MEKPDDNIDNVLDIDEFALDREWLRQPRMYREWSQKLADARKDWEDAKVSKEIAEDTLKNVEALVDLEVRKSPESFDLDKVTEGAVKNTVILDQRVVDAKNTVHKAMRSVARVKHRADSVESVVKTLDQRKSSLENLVYLHGQSYFAQPRERGGSENGMAEATSERVFGRNKKTHKGE